MLVIQKCYLKTENTFPWLLVDLSISNGYVERCTWTVRYDRFNQYLFETFEEMQNFAARWLWKYNNERPNMANGGFPPAMKRNLAAWDLLQTKRARRASVSSLPKKTIMSLKCEPPIKPISAVRRGGATCLKVWPLFAT